MNQKTNAIMVIEVALHAMHANMSEDTGMAAIAAICDGASSNVKLAVPMDVRAMSPDEDLNDAASIPMSYHILQDEEGGSWLCAFTQQEEADKIPGTISLQLHLADILSTTASVAALAGLVINPFGEMIQLHQDLISGIIDALKSGEVNG